MNELRVNEGIHLYVEEKTENCEKWVEEFELETNRCTVKFNKIGESVYDERIAIDRRCTVE